MENSVDANGQVHRPVLYQEILDALKPERGGRYVDCTLGAGGHAVGILQHSSPDGLLLGLDLDPHILHIARQRLQQFGGRTTILQASYTKLAEHLQQMGWASIQGVLLDLGVSSLQLDTPVRGFSFQADAPLDMRFDPDGVTTASDLVNTLPEADLAKILFEYGEEPRARQIARAILRNRPLTTTRQLAEVIISIMPFERRGERKQTRRSHIHPATKTFQALRIAVNKELEAIKEVLPQAVSGLAPGGRLAVISFHSLEDRIVKQFFRLESQDCICPPRQPVCTCAHRASLIEITRRPVMAGEAEVLENSRARSARLRVAEKK